jgi:hypothetical protein
MKIWSRVLALLVTTLVLNACGGIPVSTDYDPGWRLPEPATFAWMSQPHRQPVADPLVDNDLVAGRIRRAVNEQLEARGLREAASEQQADVLATYHVGQEERLDITSFRSSYGYYPCWNCFGYGPGFDSDIWVTQYTQGKLIIDLVDAKTKKLVWRGMATRRLPSFRTPAERDAYIRETVTAIFKDFPPH